MDYKCDLNCPAVDNPPLCCKGCQIRRRYHVNDANKNLWTVEHGFWSESGCKLQRDEMPDDCKEYNCKGIKWLLEVKWAGTGWRVLHAYEIPIDSEPTGIVLDRKEEWKL